MVSSPLCAQLRVKTILDYKDQLKLSQAQVEKIKAYLFDLEKELRELRGRLVSVNGGDPASS